MQATAVRMNDRMIAGPAPGRSALPAVAVPMEAKMPVPITAPIPSIVRSRPVSVRFSPWRLSPASWVRRSTALVRNRAPSVTRIDLGLPSLHDLGIHGPQPDALARYEIAPVLADLRTDVGEPDAHPPGKVFQWPKVDTLVHGRGAGPRPRHREIRNAVRDHRQGDRCEDEIALLHDAGHLLEERVEVGQGVAGRKPGPQIVLDLADALAGEVLDRMEGLRLVGILAPDRPDEQLSRLLEASELVEMAVNVVGQERHGVVVGAGTFEGAARVDAHEQGHPRLALGGLEAASGEQDDLKPDDRHEAARADPGAHYWLPAFLGCGQVDPAISPVSMMSFRLFRGRLMTGFVATRTMAKFRAAARTCRKGSARYSRISWHLACSQSASRLKSWISSCQVLTGSGRDGAVAARPACSIGSREMKASSGGVPYCPNRNHVIPRMPIHPNVATVSVKPIPRRKRSPVCCAIHGVIASTSSR